MALPAGGELTFLSIAQEQAITVSDVSLRSMSEAAGFTTPDSVSEFYSYTAYNYYATYYAGDPCNYDSYDIYQGPSGMYYRYTGTTYDPMFNYTDLWYEYLYYDSKFDINIYKEWAINSSSTILTDYGNTASPC